MRIIQKIAENEKGGPTLKGQFCLVHVYSDRIAVVIAVAYSISKEMRPFTVRVFPQPILMICTDISKIVVFDLSIGAHLLEGQLP